jgi:TonB family protein
VLLMSFRRLLVFALMTTVVGLAVAPNRAWAEEDRKVRSRIDPVYPDLARRMNVTGTVKVMVVIASNGSVKSAKPLGGHPLLIESAVEAVKKWKYEPAAEETTTTVQFTFTGSQ